MARYYYFAFANDDPMRTTYTESELTVEEMRKRFVGTWVQTGDEPHDVARIADIWTAEQAARYYE